MPLAPQQVRKLRAKLNERHVRSREVEGKSIAYLEGWHVIAEANRIFGFDGWDRELIDSSCVYTKQQGDRFNAAYVARIRIRVRAGEHMITREGSGAGESSAASPGQAHELALKAAETDATKRALMTFGNPFGLSLYGAAREEREAAPQFSANGAVPSHRNRAAVQYSTQGPALNGSRQAFGSDIPPDRGNGNGAGRHGAGLQGSKDDDALAKRRDTQHEHAKAEPAASANPPVAEQGLENSETGLLMSGPTSGNGKAGANHGDRAYAVRSGALSHITQETSGEQTPVPDEGQGGSAAEPASASTLATALPMPRPRIDKSALALNEPTRIRDAAHLKFVASQPCLICGRNRAQAHHLRFAQPKAMGRKVSDEYTVPLCSLHHQMLHQTGNEIAWWEYQKIDPLKVAAELWRQSRTTAVNGHQVNGHSPAPSDEYNKPGTGP